MASDAAAELLDRFAYRAGFFHGDSGFFRAKGALHWNLKGMLHHNLTSFATQVYAIHGLAEHARVMTGNVSDTACRAAERLVEKQGALGQWWWLYSSRTGNVLEGYPVYSVHQDGMAFMALASLQDFGVRPYESELGLGLEWLFGKNELGQSLIDAKRKSIARCVQRIGSDPDGFGGISRTNQARTLLGSFGLGNPARSTYEVSELEVLAECRSYHYGWLLYANSLMRAKAVSQASGRFNESTI